jgi:assimilatory nitrate reductase catalytic subunit
VETGPIVCACRGVRSARIEQAIAAGAKDIEAVSESTGAGAACGSCRPEIVRLLSAARSSNEVSRAA